mmetsp:Transcript_1991/g.4314  ORF Transcript_1991/g.4314 Transcript_1991/m.4314 type:complete len:525 (-) Transcript_1991:108-1682(-)
MVPDVPSAVGRPRLHRQGRRDPRSERDGEGGPGVQIRARHVQPAVVGGPRPAGRRGQRRAYLRVGQRDIVVARVEQKQRAREREGRVAQPHGLEGVEAVVRRREGGGRGPCVQRRVRVEDDRTGALCARAQQQDGCLRLVEEGGVESHAHVRPDPVHERDGPEERPEVEPGGEGGDDRVWGVVGGSGGSQQLHVACGHGLGEETAVVPVVEAHRADPRPVQGPRLDHSGRTWLVWEVRIRFGGHEIGRVRGPAEVIVSEVFWALRDGGGAPVHGLVVAAAAGLRHEGGEPRISQVVGERLDGPVVPHPEPADGEARRRDAVHRGVAVDVPQLNRHGHVVKGVADVVVAGSDLSVLDAHDVMMVVEHDRPAGDQEGQPEHILAVGVEGGFARCGVGDPGGRRQGHDQHLRPFPGRLEDHVEAVVREERPGGHVQRPGDVGRQPVAVVAVVPGRIAKQGGVARIRVQPGPAGDVGQQLHQPLVRDGNTQVARVHVEDEGRPVMVMVTVVLLVPVLLPDDRFVVDAR